MNPKVLKAQHIYLNNFKATTNDLVPFMEKDAVNMDLIESDVRSRNQTLLIKHSLICPSGITILNFEDRTVG